MRSFMILAAVPMLAGCAVGANRIGPGVLPADASGAIYTAQSTAEVAACVADAIGGTSRVQGDRHLVISPRSPEATYDVGPNAMAGDYPTEVVIRGPQDAAEQQKAGSCLASSGRSA